MIDEEALRAALLDAANAHDMDTMRQALSRAAAAVGGLGAINHRATVDLTMAAKRDVKKTYGGKPLARK